VVRPGEDATIQCSATGDQPIRLEWSKEGQPYLPRSVFASEGRLEFRRISSDDQGRYTCTGSNQIGTSEATAEVIVSSKWHSFFGPRPRVTQKNCRTASWLEFSIFLTFLFAGDEYNFNSAEEVTARLGSNVDLYCRLVTSNNSTLRWERSEGKSLNSARVTQFPQGLLRIQSVQLEDAGIYMCHRDDQTQYLRLNVDPRKSTWINVIAIMIVFVNYRCSVSWFWVIFFLFDYPFIIR
jgi:hypothetical protein